MWLDYARASSVLGASMSGQAASNVSPIALYVPAKVTNKHTAVLVVRVAAGVKQGVEMRVSLAAAFGAAVKGLTNAGVLLWCIVHCALCIVHC
jgi:hypothetical protein